MKKILFTLLLTIPFLGFGQTSNLEETLRNSVWKITLEETGWTNIIVLNDVGSFGMISNLYGVPVVYNTEEEDWKIVKVDGKEKVVITFTNRFLVLSGNVYNRTMSGTYVNTNGLSGTWKGEKLD
jgi:hypothetical protein